MSTSSVDRYLDGNTHRVDIASIRVFGFKSNLMRRAKELGRKVLLEQDGAELVVRSLPVLAATNGTRRRK